MNEIRPRKEHEGQLLRRLPIATLVSTILLVALLSSATGYWFARRATNLPNPQSPTSDASKSRTVLYWYDPMVPNQHFDKAGPSPFMNMPLVPKYADQADPTAGIRIDPSMVQNLGIRLASVERGTHSRSLNAVGSIVFDQRLMAVVQARAAGFVTRVYALAPGDVIQRGAALVDLLVPEWAGAQAEFLALSESGDHDLIEASRQRLSLMGMPADLIAALEADRKPRTTFTVRTPISGAIESLEIRAGMTVSAGATLAKINGLTSVWLEAAIPEAQAAVVTPGRAVEARLSAYPSEIFKGDVIAILPEANIDSRTVRLRIALPNANQRLRPGMFAQARLSAADEKPALWVPTEAVIHTGRRDLVIVKTDHGPFTPTEIQTGGEVDGRTLILSGLSEGQRVVASGQFLIDSEASLRGVLAKLSGDQPSRAPTGMQGNDAQPKRREMQP
jgi:Cu(I)/Ag(I) efflux system membrane fusion protein